MEIITYILVIYALLTPYFCFRAIKFGVSIAQHPEKIPEERIFHVPKKKKTPKMTPQEDRMNQILRNIDNYNGSSEGQIKVEVENG